MLILPNSSINLALKVGQSLMLERDPLLFNGMAWSISTTLAGLSHLIKENPEPRTAKGRNHRIGSPVVGDKFGRLETGRGWFGVEQTVGRRRGQWGGGTGVGVEDLQGEFVSGMEVGAVIQHDVRVRVYSTGVLIVGGGQFKNVIF